MPQPRMKDGMNAEPSCRRQAMAPTSLTMTLAQKPKKIPAGDRQYFPRRGTRSKLTSHNPKLPEHHKGASNSMWGHLGGINGNRGVLCTNANT